TEPLRLQRRDDEKHAHCDGGRLGEDEPEIAHGLSGRASAEILDAVTVRLRGMRGATRTPLYRDYCAKRLCAPPLPRKTAPTASRAHCSGGIGGSREFDIRINKLGHKIWSGAMLSV